MSRQEDAEPAKRLVAKVVNQLSTGSTFAADEESGEGVFINSRLARSVQAQLGDRVVVDVMPNMIGASHERDERSPWFAIYVQKIYADTDVKQFMRVIPEDILLPLFSDGPLTTTEVAQRLKEDRSVVNLSLVKLHYNGRLARSPIYRTALNKSPSVVLWGVDEKQLLGE